MTINKDWLNEETGKYKCPHCSKEYTKMGIATHIMRMHTDKEKFSNCTSDNVPSWNKGLKAKTDERVRKNSENAIKVIRTKEVRDKISKANSGKKNIRGS